MAQHDTQAPESPAFLNQIAVDAPAAQADQPPRVASVQIARWDNGRRLAWHTLNQDSPIYQWALDGIHAATNQGK